MNFQALFARAPDRVLNVGLIGVGEFGASLADRARKVKQMQLVAFCDREPERVKAELAGMGIDGDDVLVTNDPQALLDARLDVLVEATGDPEAGARHAVRALESGIDVVMVTKETDSVVGPYLADLARRHERVYTPVEGDQPALLIGLASWAGVLGLEIAAAGKSSEYDFVFDQSARTVTCRAQALTVMRFRELWELGSDGIEETLELRAAALGGLPLRTVPDYCEMCIVANATGFVPDIPELHAPVARTVELPDILRPRERGGILSGLGKIEVFNCLRRPDEASFAGGVYVVVTGLDRKTCELLRGKGIPVDRGGEFALLYNPSHLLGVEAPMTILEAGLLRLSSGAAAPRPVCDVLGRTNRALPAGHTLALGARHAIDGLDPLLVPAKRAAGTNPIPFYLAAGGTLTRDVPAGTILTVDVVRLPQDGVLRGLRSAQDDVFGL